MPDHVRHERHGAVELLTLHRPEKLNALSNELIAELQAALDACEASAQVRAVVLTGAGRAFSAGADIAGFAPRLEAGADEADRAFVRPGQALTRRVELFPKPVLAAVNGLAYGGGLELLEATHLAVASTEATFAKAEIDLGIIPCFGGTQRLPRIVGRKRALELILTGAAIGAEEALRLGVVNRVVAPERVVPEALALAELVASKSAVAVAAALAAVVRGLEVAPEAGLAVEAESFRRVAASAEARAGVDSFLAARGGRSPGAASRRG
jgi:enoyl-CoA hydratase/carnithine racemase